VKPDIDVDESQQAGQFGYFCSAYHCIAGYGSPISCEIITVLRVAVSHSWFQNFFLFAQYRYWF
jgi:hypothetical protein